MEKPSYCSRKCNSTARLSKAEHSWVGRFNARFSEGLPDECWLWVGSKNAAGYGVFSFRGRMRIASRIMWLRTYGAIPNLLVCHSCDNPACVNPGHLWLGTDLDNANDREAKGRGKPGTRPIGMKHWASKLTDDDICALRSDSASADDLANRFGISKQQVKNIKARRHWSHVV